LYMCLLCCTCTTLVLELLTIDEYLQEFAFVLAIIRENKKGII
jgi:hypothetical protein